LGRIRVLSDNIANKIAAGEVVRLNLDSVAGFTRVTLGLTVRRT